MQHRLVGMEDQHEAVFWLLLGLPLVGVLLTGAVRWVPSGHLLIATRRGVVSRVSGPGLFWRLPLVEQVELVPSGPEDVPVAAHATSRDGTELRLLATAWVRRLMPAPEQRYADPVPAAVASIELVLASAVADAELGAVSETLAEAWDDLTAEIRLECLPHGAEVLGLDLDGVEALLSTSPERDDGPPHPSAK